MMIPIRELEARYDYYVSYEKKLVIAKITFDELVNVLMCEVRRAFQKLPYQVEARDLVIHWLGQNISPTGYISRAKCSPDDEFNEEIGELIAGRRLTAKISFLTMKFFDYLSECLYQNKCVLENIADKYDTRVDNACKAVDRFIERAVQ